MTGDDTHGEIRALCALAAEQAVRRQAAMRQNDRPARREIEVELSRVWSRHCDLEREVA